MPMDADGDGDVFFDAEEGPMEDDMSVSPLFFSWSCRLESC
jgi:hypothetical protein